MKQSEFEDWVRTAKPKGIQKRSKVIIKMDKVIMEMSEGEGKDIDNDIT